MLILVTHLITYPFIATTTLIIINYYFIFSFLIN